jgi:hypothetical protein
MQDHKFAQHSCSAYSLVLLRVVQTGICLNFQTKQRELFILKDSFIIKFLS